MIASTEGLKLGIRVECWLGKDTRQVWYGIVEGEMNEETKLGKFFQFILIRNSNDSMAARYCSRSFD